MATSETPRWRLILGGRTAPGSYLAVGSLLALFKMVLDRVVAWQFFGRPSSLLGYAITGDVRNLLLTPEDRTFYGVMLALALPFLIVALVLTVRRLRDAGWPLWLAVITFAPVPINLVFFLVLSQIPSWDAPIRGGLVDEIDGLVDVPEKKVGPAGVPSGDGPSRMLPAIAIPVAAGAVAAYLATYVFRNYGASLFLGLPFVLPMLSVVIYGFGRGVTFGRALKVGWLCALAAVLLMLVVAFEGIICIIMMIPLAAPIITLGAIVGYFIVAIGPRRATDHVKVASVLIALMPTMVGAEYLATPEPLRFTCETSITVDAPPEEVWKHVVRFSDLDPPDDWIFATGLAYPVRARIEGAGVGAVRRCEFSTGTFVEPIEVWDEPRLLRFSVTESPAPMREWSPIFEAHPPHLDGFLVSERGQFELVPMPGGGTLLKGSTLYRHGLWPASYWRLWSDPIIHRIHDRVLRHVKRLSESGRP